MKKNILLFTMIACLFSGCDFSIWEIKNKDEKKPIQKKNNIAELKPKHRFAMPLEDVGNEKKFKETVKNILKYELYDIAEVTEEIFKKFPNPSEDKDFKLDYKMIMRDFPNLSKEELKANDSLIARYYAVNLDYEVLQILKKTKTPKKEKKDLKLKVDFPKSYGYGSYGNPPASMPCSAISFPTDRNKFLMNYYLPCQTQNSQGNINVVSVMSGSSQSIPCKCVEEEYQKLQPIWADQAKKQQKRAMNDCIPKIGGWRLSGKTLAGMVGIMVNGGYVIVGGSLFFMNPLLGTTIAIVGVSTVTYALCKSLDAHYKYENKEIKYDAVKHLYWQMLLCKYYNPVWNLGSKNARIDFAKKVGDLYEEHGDNDVDDSYMDLHNNDLARRLWRDHYSWYAGWWIFSWIETVNNTALLQAARTAYGKVQIVHDNIIELKRNNSWKYQDYDAYYKLDDEPKKPDMSKYYKTINICNRKYWILNDAEDNRPVENRENQ